MRNFELTGIRLITLAEHLENGKLFEKYERLHFLYSDDKKKLLIGLDDKYHCIMPQAICELPGLFTEFKKTPNGMIKYDGIPEFDPYFGMLDFFGLKVPEFLHLFGVNCQQTNKYGGKILDIDYTSQEIAFNIFEFLQVIINERKAKLNNGKK